MAPDININPLPSLLARTADVERLQQIQQNQPHLQAHLLSIAGEQRARQKKVSSPSRSENSRRVKQSLDGSTRHYAAPPQRKEEWTSNGLQDEEGQAHVDVTV